jgi:hypothetical protein
MNNKEVRLYNMREMQVRDENYVFGYAALFNSLSEEMWGFREIIAPGSFNDTDMTDVRALFNHDNNLLLARTSSGTLSIEVDENGLRYEFEAPKTSYGKDLVELMKRGDVSQSSFGFTIDRDGEYWEQRDGEDMPTRYITRIKKLYDVSPVTYPAYPDTTVAVRSLEQFRKQFDAQKYFDLFDKKLQLLSKLI